VTDEDELEIMQMYEQGVSIADIAAEMAFTTNTVRKMLRKNDIVVAASKSTILDRMSMQDIEALKEDSYQGMSVIEICRKWGFKATQSFYVLVHELGWTPRQFEKTTIQAKKLREDKAIEMYQQGHPLWFISQETGLYQPQIHALIHREGLTLRRPRGESKVVKHRPA